jgi:hypothetical protein
MKFSLIILAFCTIINAQYVSVKSLPVAAGDQFILYPSANLAMGNVNIAMADKWSDPFTNPALAGVSDKSGMEVFVQPTSYFLTNSLGGARTLPLSFFGSYANFFGTLSVSYQQMESSLNNNSGFVPETEKIKNNQYAYVSAGMDFAIQGLSAGVGLFLADLNAMGGVDLLYANSADIKQNGNIREVKGGLLYKKEAVSMEMVGFYNVFEMKHTVSYPIWDWFTDDVDRLSYLADEINIDKTQTMGLHIKYREAITDGPFIAAIVSYNWKTHPKIPNYSIMNIPRDPGNTWAFNFGLGVADENEKRRVGLDFIYEPIWSNTWATAETEITDIYGMVISAGQKTVENNFAFNNWIGRIGYNHTFQFIDWSIGLHMHNYSYSLKQDNFINRSSRAQQENWLEYIWSWGAGLKFKHFNIAYNGRVTTGSGIPSTFSNGWGWGIMAENQVRTADFIAAPSGKMRIDYQSIYTHQFVINIPLINSTL